MRLSRKQENELLKDAVQMAFNYGGKAFVCPLAGQSNKPDQHDWWCFACRTRLMLGERFVRTEVEVAEREKAIAS